MSRPAITAMTCPEGTATDPAHVAGGGRLVATVPAPDGSVLGLLQDR